MFAPGSILDIFKEVLIGYFATDQHIEELIDAMRNNDVREVQRLLEITPLHSIIPEGIENSTELGYEEKNKIVRTLRSLSLIDNPKIMQLVLESGLRLDFLDAQLQDKPQQSYVLSRLLPTRTADLPAMHDNDHLNLKLFRAYIKFYQQPNLARHKEKLTNIKQIYWFEKLWLSAFATLICASIIQRAMYNECDGNKSTQYRMMLEDPRTTILTNIPLLFDFDKDRYETKAISALKFSNLMISYFSIQPMLAHLLQDSLSKEQGEYRAHAALLASLAILFMYSVTHLIYINPAMDFVRDLPKILEQEKFNYALAREQIPQVIKSRFGEPTALLFTQRAAAIRQRETAERQEIRQPAARASRLETI